MVVKYVDDAFSTIGLQVGEFMFVAEGGGTGRERKCVIAAERVIRHCIG